MAGLSAVERDLTGLPDQLRRWWMANNPDDGAVEVSSFRTNPSSGYSSECLLFDLSAGGVTGGYVLRLAPAGGGLFPEYDLERQSRTQQLLVSAGVPAPPAIYEPDPAWIGEPFMVMPLVAGHIPGDYVYPVKGWLHDAGPAQQGAVYGAFVDGLVGLLTVDPGAHEVTFLRRRRGPGLRAEIAWWADYLDWASDGRPPPLMVDAFAWAQDTAPADVDRPSITWGDARFANAIFDDAGAVAGLLDWEQAAVGPAELDVGFWLATRRQSCHLVHVTTDPELPGFLDRATTLARIERGLGRPLRALAWHETFAMVRMGVCVVGTQSLLRRTGQHDHALLGAPLLPPWTIAAIAGAGST